MTHPVHIEWFGGNCPVQAEGTIDGVPFYFRARYEEWELRVGPDPMADDAFCHAEAWGTSPYDTGWMTPEAAIELILLGASLYHSARKSAAPVPNKTPKDRSRPWP